MDIPIFQKVGHKIKFKDPSDRFDGSVPLFSDFTFDGSILPWQAYRSDVGSLTKKIRTVYAGELLVETLVAANTQATLGGRIVTGPTTILLKDISAAATSADVKYSLGTSGTIICHMESNGSLEWISIDCSTQQIIAGGYRYTIVRNLQGTTAKAWVAGTAIASTQGVGGGFIDIYSVSNMKNTNILGPSIVGNVRNSLTYNDWSECWAIGNLNGLYGYTTNKYGAGFGKYANSSSFITIDPTNGIRFIYKNAGGTESTKLSLSMAGAISIDGYATSAEVGNKTSYNTTAPSSPATGDIWFDTSNSLIVMKRWSGSAWITTSVVMDGSGLYAGNISAGQVTAGTFTGFTFQTSASGKRVVMSSSTNGISVYNSSNYNVISIEAGASLPGIIINEGVVSVSTSTTGYTALTGTTTTGTAISATSNSGYGIYAKSTSNYALYVDGNSSFTGQVTVAGVTIGASAGHADSYFALSGHNHSGVYSVVGHTHPQSDLTTGWGSVAPVTDYVAQTSGGAANHAVSVYPLNSGGTSYSVLVN